MNILDELNWRGLFKQISNKDKLIKAQKENKSVYCGFDPTADSLHIGHLIPLMLLERFRLAGFKPIALIGGGTGMIGDPSFKSQERILQTFQQVTTNSLAIKQQITNLIPKVKILNNIEWLSPMSLIEFLRDVGKDFNLAYLLSKETISSRIDTGLSITEFIYTILQAYDFYELYKNRDCYVQIGGSDQWGNITSGLDFISSKIGKEKSQACGLTIQLLTKKDGKKFGKTESGTLWLDSKKTSEYEFYQFWLNQDDKITITLLKFFTFLTEKEINDLISNNVNPKERLLQKKLAEKVTLFVHKEEGLKKAQLLSEAFFQGKINNLTPELLKIALNSLTETKISYKDNAIEAIIKSGAANSKREAREFLTKKSITFNDVLVKNEEETISNFKLIDNKYLLLKRGKRKYFLLNVENR